MSEIEKVSRAFEQIGAIAAQLGRDIENRQMAEAIDTHLGTIRAAMPRGVDREKLVRDLLWHVEQVCGPLSTEPSVVVGDDDRSVLAHNFRATLAPSTGQGEDRVATLFDAIAHGDEAHRAWLLLAIENHFAGKPVPAANATLSPVRDERP